MAYADRYGMDHGETDAFVEIIATMDAAWLDWHEKREEQKRKADTKS